MGKYFACKTALLALSLAICAPGHGACQAAEATQPLKAALVLEHDQPSSWNDLLRAGFERGCGEFGMDGRVTIAPPGSAQREIFRKACEDANLVIVASDNLHEALRDNAANFRRVNFGSVDAGIRAPNIMSVTFADEQAAFLAGAAAAMITKNQKVRGINGENTIGWLSGEDTPAMRSLFNGFSEGARLADPQTRVVQAVVGSFTDPQTAAKKAEWLMDAGADIIALAAGAGNSDARRAIGSRGGHVILLDKADGDNLAIAKAVDRAVFEIMQSAASPKFRGKEIVVYNLANKGVDFSGVSAFSRKEGVSEDLARRMGELRREIENDSIRLHSLRARTLCDCLD